MKFDHVRDIISRYLETYVVYKGVLNHVIDIQESKEHQAILKLQSIIGKNTSVPYLDPEVILDPPGGGLGHQDGYLIWSIRNPRRRWKQGFSTGNYRFNDVIRGEVRAATALISSLLIPKYTPLGDIDKKLKAKGLCIINRYLGIQVHKGNNLIIYRNDIVGLYKENMANLVKGYEFLEDTLTRSGSNIKNACRFSSQDLKRGTVEISLADFQNLDGIEPQDRLDNRGAERANPYQKVKGFDPRGAIPNMGEIIEKHRRDRIQREEEE